MNKVMSSLYSIEKLDENNYSSWAIQMKSILVHLELWSIVSGKLVLSNTATPEQSAAFDAKDEKALASIMLCIKPSQITHILHCQTSQSAWNKLKEIHQPCGPVRKITLFKQLLYKKLKDCDNMMQHLNEFSEAVENLAQIGVKVQEELLVIMVLSSLPESYENFIVAIETRDNLPTLSAIKTKLLEEETRRSNKCEQDGAVSSHQAFVAKENGSSSNNCKQQFNSSQHPQSSSNNNGSRTKFKCYNCGRRGHFASKCRDQKKNKEKKVTSFVVNTNFSNGLSRETWCIDSGATCHLCCDRGIFSNFVAKSEKIVVAGNKHIYAEGYGEVDLVVDTVIGELHLKNVLFVPNLQCNFISVNKAVQSNLKVIFDKDKAAIKDKNDNIIVSANNFDGLFTFKTKNKSCFLANNNNVSLIEWHNRYGHLNFESLTKMINKNMVLGLNVGDKNLQNCLTCAKGKICAKPFYASKSRSEELLNIVHSDICGPMNKISIGGAKYFITFIDDMSRYVHVYFLKRKDEALEAFKSYKAMAENKTGRKIKILRSDNGGEYKSKDFENFLNSCGILHQYTIPYTPEQNGVAERANRTLTEMARCMLIHSGLGEQFWAEAIATAAYLRNRAETKTLLEKTPFESWTGKVPSVGHLKVFGSLAVVLDKTHKKKFQPKGREVIMVGYSTTSKGYRLYDPKTRQVIIGRDVVFINGVQNEFKENTADVMMFEPEAFSDSIVSATQDNIEELNEKETGDLIDHTTVRYRPGRPRIMRTGKPGRPPKMQQVLSCTQNIVEAPKNVREAIEGEHREQWLESMKHEFNALIRNKTWSLVDLPENRVAIGSKWVYNVKRNADGSIQKFKSRLVAKGCAQKFGINYNETFSPVVRYETIRMIVALAAEHNLYLHQMDVSSAYLNSDLKETVYMKQPEQFVSQEFPNKVCKLNKAIYGLKQSGREWNEKIDKVLKEMGFTPCASEPCVYTRNYGGNFNIIAVYVDDLLLASSRKEDIDTIKQQIELKFDVVDGGKLHYFLGMQFERHGETGDISVCQKKYIEDLLQEYGMAQCKSISTPMDPGFQISCSKENCQRINKTNYQSLIGALMYLAMSSRPDILHATCKLAQCNMDPHIEHWTSAKRILRYLNGTKDFKLHYSKTNQPVTCYVDADWGGDTTDRKSFTGWVFIAAGGAIAWESKKQNIIALSSTEAEYVALSSAAKQTTYIVKIMNEMGFEFQRSIVLHSDNQSAQHLVKNPVFHNRSKHIDIKFHHIRELYKQNKIKLNYCPTYKMIADVLTKNLAKTKHCLFTNDMGMY